MYAVTYKSADLLWLADLAWLCLGGSAFGFKMAVFDLILCLVFASVPCCVYSEDQIERRGSSHGRSVEYKI